MSQGFQIKFKDESSFAKQVVRQYGKQGVAVAVNHLLAQSKQEVPHDTGALEQSGTAEAEESGNGAQGVISYDTPYAVTVHEQVNRRYQRGRKAKYLEDPVNNPANHSAILNYLADNLRQGLK